MQNILLSNFLVIGFDMIIIFIKAHVGNLLKLLKDTTGQKQPGIKVWVSIVTRALSSENIVMMMRNCFHD